MTRADLRLHNATAIAAVALLYLMAIFFGILYLALLAETIMTWRDWFRLQRELRASALPRAQVVRS